MQALGRRGDVLEVGEHPARFEQVIDFAAQRPLALVLEVVDHQRGDDGVEAPEVRQRLGEVVLDEFDASDPGEPLARGGEHQLGEVEADPEHLRALPPQVIEQAAVAGPDVEDATGVERHVLEQDALSLCPARKLIRPPQVVIDVLGVRPLLGVHGADYRRARRRFIRQMM